MLKNFTLMFFLYPFLGMGQTNHSKYEDEIINYFKTYYFKNYDSIYKFGVSANKYGTIHYNFNTNKLIDSSLLNEDKQDLFVFFKRNGEGVKYLVRKVYLGGGDTIDSYRVARIIYPTTKEDTIENTVWGDNPLIDDIHFSFLYSKLEKFAINKEKQKTLRLLLPNDVLFSNKKHYYHPNPEIKNDDYSFFEVKFCNDKTILIRKIISSQDTAGYKIVKTDTAVLKDKHVNKLNKEFELIKEFQEEKCKDGSVQTLIEVWDAPFYKQIPINDCFIRQHKFASKVSIYQTLIYLNFKYFD